MAATIQVYRDPPPDVQAAVTAVIKACAGWHKTEVPLQPPSASIESAAPTPLNEARVCSYLANPNAIEMQGFSVAIMLALFVVGVCFLTHVHRLPGVLYRLARSAVTRRWRAAS